MSLGLFESLPLLLLFALALLREANASPEKEPETGLGLELRLFSLLLPLGSREKAGEGGGECPSSLPLGATRVGVTGRREGSGQERERALAVVDIGARYPSALPPSPCPSLWYLFLYFSISFSFSFSFSSG
jgi:hypothetical protein